MEERFLEIFITPLELGPNLEEIILSILKENSLNKEIQRMMITNMKINDFNNIPLSRTTTNTIEISVPVKVIYKIYKPDDIILGDLFTDDLEKKVFVISNDIICNIVNRDDIEDKKITNINVKILNIKHTSSCSYFLAEGIII